MKTLSELQRAWYERYQTARAVEEKRKAKSC